MRSTRQARESVDPKKNLQDSGRLKKVENRRKSQIDTSKPKQQKDEKPNPPQRNINLFGGINDFFLKNGKEKPFPKNSRSFDKNRLHQAAADLLLIIDDEFEGFKKDMKLDHEFCDIMEIIGYPYEIRKVFRQTPCTPREISSAVDPLYWLITLLTTYQEYINIPLEEKKYDEKTRKNLDFFDKVIESYALWFNGKDFEAEEIINYELNNNEDENDRDEQKVLKSHHAELLTILENLDRDVDPSNEIEEEIRQLELIYKQKDSELSELTQKREEFQKKIKELDDHEQDLSLIESEILQESEKMKNDIKKLPYDPRNIQDLINKPNIIKTETNHEEKEIASMQADIEAKGKEIQEQLRALAMLASDMNNYIKDMNAGEFINIKSDGKTTDDLFGIDLNKVVGNILQNKPDIQKVENERARISKERDEIEEEIQSLKIEEENLLKELKLKQNVKSQNNEMQEIDKINKQIIKIQNENLVLSRGIEEEEKASKAMISELDKKYNTVKSQISDKLNAYVQELKRVQTEVQ